MSREISFTKMVASGNDFVVIDNRKKAIKITPAFVKKVCTAHTGVGADGILLVDNSRKAKFKMRIINSDGSEAEACGNGFRCIAKYAREVMDFPATFKFDSGAGIIGANIRGKSITVGLSKPFGLKLRDQIEVEGHRLHYSFLNTGVPHVVIFVEGLKKIDVQTLGRAIRQHKKFKPKGTNVNFVEVSGKDSINVRTYERGVESETLACGTGSTASAIISVLSGFVKSPVQVKTKSGEILTINFKRQGNRISNVTLQGEAHFVYEGRLLNGKK